VQLIYNSGERSRVVSLAFFSNCIMEKTMKHFPFLMVAGILTALIGGNAAWALPPFNKEWLAKYVTDNPNAEFVAAVGTAKCNVCHKGTSKKDHNEYGLALKKFITKKGYDAVKANPVAAAKYITDGLAAGEAEKNAAGKAFGEVIKAGELPGK
jgi:hypothetical protein